MVMNIKENSYGKIYLFIRNKRGICQRYKEYDIFPIHARKDSSLSLYL